MELTEEQFKYLKIIVDSYRARTKPSNPSHVKEFFQNHRMDNFIYLI